MFTVKLLQTTTLGKIRNCNKSGRLNYAGEFQGDNTQWNKVIFYTCLLAYGLRIKLD